MRWIVFSGNQQISQPHEDGDRIQPPERRVLNTKQDNG